MFSLPAMVVVCNGFMFTQQSEQIYREKFIGVTNCPGTKLLLMLVTVSYILLSSNFLLPPTPLVLFDEKTSLYLVSYFQKVWFQLHIMRYSSYNVLVLP